MPAPLNVLRSTEEHCDKNFEKLLNDYNAVRHWYFTQTILFFYMYNEVHFFLKYSRKETITIICYSMGRGYKFFKARLTILVAVRIVATCIIPSRPGCISMMRARFHFIGRILSSLTTTRRPMWMFSWLAVDSICGERLIHSSTPYATFPKSAAASVERLAKNLTVWFGYRVDRLPAH